MLLSPLGYLSHTSILYLFWLNSSPNSCVQWSNSYLETVRMNYMIYFRMCSSSCLANLTPQNPKRTGGFDCSSAAVYLCTQKMKLMRHVFSHTVHDLYMIMIG